MAQTDTKTNKSKKDLLWKSFGACLVFMILYVISFYTIPLTNNQELNYIVFSPIVFVLSWVFFYFFILLKDGSSLKYYLLACLLLACVFIYTNGIFNVDIMFENFFNSSKLPRGYEKYVDINNKKNKFGKHEIKLFIASDNPLDQFLTQNQELIIHSKTTINNANKEYPVIHNFYKLDKNGNQIAQYSFQQTSYEDNEVLFEGYLINVFQNYFRDWPLHGDTTKKTIEIVNEDFSWTKDQQRQKLAEIEKNAKFLLSKTVYDSEADNKHKETYFKITYFLNDQWYTFYEDFTDDNYLIYEVKPKGRIVNDLFGQWDQNWMRREENAPPRNIASVYYQKIQRLRDRYDVKTGNSDRGDVWRGYLFSKLIVDNDTLKFKDNLYLDEDTHRSKIEIDHKNIGTLSFESTEDFIVYSFYSNPALNYQLFTNHLNKIYLIKKIK